MKYIVALILFIPFTAWAQLSSENFQVDGFSVGSTQSTNAQSANFQTTRESGGQFILEEENQDDAVQSTGGGIRREINRSTSTTEDESDGSLDTPAINDTENPTTVKPQGDGDSAASSSDPTTSDSGVERDGSGGREILNQDESPAATTEQEGTTREDRVDYFWYWWPALLLGSLWLLWFIYRRRSGDRKSH